MKLFDSHCHYDDAMFDADREERLNYLKSTDVKHILNCCSDESVFNTVIDIVNKNDFAYCSIGIHPHWSMEISDNYLEKIEQLSQNPKVVAIGEMGLDYFWKEDKEIQKQVFIQQLQLAARMNKPVIIHDREAHKDVMDILREYKPQGVLHRYGGSAQLAKEAMSWGMYISFNNDITYPNWEKKHLDLLMAVPLDKLLVETDCPYAPIYNSGKDRCESFDVMGAIEKIAFYKHESVEKIADITYENALRVYGIKE